MLTPDANLQASGELLASAASPAPRRFAGLALALMAAVGCAAAAAAGGVRVWPQIQAALDAPQRTDEFLASAREISAGVERLKSDVNLARAETRANAIRLGAGLETLAAEQRGLVARLRDSDAQTRAGLAALDTRMSGFDRRFDRLELRLTRADEAEKPAAPRIDGDAPTARADKVLNRFGIVRVDGRSAWVVGPEGWFHVGIGDKLPGDVTVLEIGAVGGRRALITDKGVVFPASRE